MRFIATMGGGGTGAGTVAPSSLRRFLGSGPTESAASRLAAVRLFDAALAPFARPERDTVLTVTAVTVVTVCSDWWGWARLVATRTCSSHSFAYAESGMGSRGRGVARPCAKARCMGRGSVTEARTGGIVARCARRIFWLSDAPPDAAPVIPADPHWALTSHPSHLDHHPRSGLVL